MARRLEFLLNKDDAIGGWMPSIMRSPLTNNSLKLGKLSCQNE